MDHHRNSRAYPDNPKYQPAAERDKPHHPRNSSPRAVNPPLFPIEHPTIGQALDMNNPSTHTNLDLHVAPMMGYTDRYLRYLLRYIAPHCWLYTEMITASALLHRDPEMLLTHHPSEPPLVLQLGGAHPNDLHRAAKIAAEHGYRHLNLNAGCPSSKVQNGGIGACLYKDVNRLVECTEALRVDGIDSVSVKTRIGVDDCDDYTHLYRLAQRLAKTSCAFLILHARKAWLEGLSPKQNRTLPPLDYERVYRLRSELAALPIIVNGGLRNWSDCQVALEKCDGVMLGRAVTQNPLVLMEVHRRLWGGQAFSLVEIFEHYFTFVKEEVANNAERFKWRLAVRHLPSFIRNAPHASTTRRGLSQARNLETCENLCLRFALDFPPQS